MAVALALAGGLLAGCESSGGGGDGGGNANVAGRWSLTNGGSTWYITFGQDGNWKITDNSDGSGQRVYGTYSLSGNNVSGPMKNPGVGTGEIKATVNGDAIALDFIEHWHTPYKTVPYTGRRL